MGRYSKELKAPGQDPAGKYLEGARQRRKEHLAEVSAPKAVEWPVFDLPEFDLQTVKAALDELAPGGRLAFAGLSKEQRKAVHELAHRLGCSNTSRAASGGRQVCVTRPKTASGGRSLDLEAKEVQRRSRWRRAARGEESASAAPAEPAEPAQLAEPAEPAEAVEEASVPRTMLGSGEAKSPVCIVWLREDMRLQDNPALLRARDFATAVPIFIVEEPLPGALGVFQSASLRSFDAALRRLGSALLLRRGAAAAVLRELWQELGCPEATVTWNRRYARHQREAEEALEELLRGWGLGVESFPGNVLYETHLLQPIERWQKWRGEVRAAEQRQQGQRATGEKDLEHLSGFGSFRFLSHALADLGDPPRPVATVSALPRLPRLASLRLEQLGFCSRGHGFSTRSRGTSGDWAQKIKAWWPAGEAFAQRRLEDFLGLLKKGDFEGRKRLLSDEKNTSELSPYLRFGEISARTVYWAARACHQRTDQRIFRSGHGYEAERPRANATFLRRFIWRDLAYWFLWEFPSLPLTSLRPQYEEQVWSGTRAMLRRWQQGRTGFPLVDAAMTQLWQVGWMPNYLRHLVAQMLIEYLDITWKEGLAWFDWTLVDADVAINSFMWQNGGHSGPDQWEFVLHPVNAAKACDPEGRYVRRWLPFLAECPTEYIHRPWEMPLGRPAPLVENLEEARRQHCRRVLAVRRAHPELVARNGHEWLRLPGRQGLLAKVVTRQEFRADTEEVIFYQGPAHRQERQERRERRDANQEVLSEEMRRHELNDNEL